MLDYISTEIFHRLELFSLYESLVACVIGTITNEKQEEATLYYVLYANNTGLCVNNSVSCLRLLECIKRNTSIDKFQKGMAIFSHGLIRLSLNIHSKLPLSQVLFHRTF